MQARIETAFNALDPSGRVAAECWSDYRQKIEAWRTQRASFADALREWPAVRAQLRSLVKPPELALRILHAVDSPTSFDQLTPPIAEEETRFAFLHAPLIRRRLTLGDLLLFVNWDREGLWRRVWKTSLRE
jgi:glycerol-1-phosphate dehydrogenase [NAD(P)+]